jgi:two-component system nitrate/nitrite response regulator NarL
MLDMVKRSVSIAGELEVKKLVDVSPNILIGDETRFSAHLLKNELMRSPIHMNVVACATSESEIFKALETNNIDVALIGENLESGSRTGLQILSRLRESCSNIRVILLLDSAKSRLVLDAFRGGAKGVFCRTEQPERLSKCVRAVHSGQVWANSSQLHLLLEALVNATPLRVLDCLGNRLLTGREEEVVSLVAEGLPNPSIAAKLGLSAHTISNYLFRVYDKLGISSRSELILYVLKQQQDLISH